MSACRHLLVDGPNILNAWPDLRALFHADRDAARVELFRRLATLHDVEEIRVTVVHDGRGPELSVDHPSAQPTLSVIFTPSGLTADDVIEQLVTKSADPSTCSVATDDRAERETVAAAGAVALTSADLRAWLARCAARQATAVENLHARVKRQWPRAR